MASQFEEVLAMRKTVQVGGSGQESPEMVASRTRTFIAWVNKKVEGRGLKIQNLTSDLENGIVLIKLLECLAPGKKMPGRYYARPVIKIQKVQNLAVAFKFITDVEKIAVTNIQPTHILEQKEDAAIALIWLLILHYEIGYKMVAGISLDTAFLILKRALLTWINGVLPGQNITNFNTDWRDGRLLSAVVDYCQPGLIPDHTSLKAAQSAQNVQNAFRIAETRLKVTAFMAAEELALEKPDEISLMMYLSQFCASGSHGQQTLLAWIQQQIPDENVGNFSDSWVSGKALGALTNSVSGGKFPAYSEMSPDNALGNIEQAMIAAEKILGIRRTVTPAKFGEVQLDELLRLSYLAQFVSAKDNKDTVLAIPAAAEKVDVSDIQIPNVLGEGKAVWIELDCSDAGYGEVRAEVKGRNSGNVLAAVKEVEGEDQIGTDKYHVSFEPPSVDVYDFSIFYGNEHVTGSPFSVNLYPPDPEKVEHTGTTDNSETGQDVNLNFETKEAGRGKLTAKAEGELSGSVPVKISPLGDGSFAVSFHPQFPDIYTVDVFWGKFSAQAIGELTGPVALQVNQDKKSEYLVSFKPPNPDVYMVDVSWDGKPVPGSPFMIDLLPPPAPEEVECAVPIYNEPGEEAELLVDASNAGSGNIKAQCAGEKVGDVPVELSKMAGRTYQCTFTPPEKDLYTLDVLFDNKHVKGSPFKIDMRPGAVQEFGEIEEQPLVQATPDASKCVLLNPPQSGTIVPIGQPLTFAVDCKQAGPGKLDVGASGPGVRENPPEISIKPRLENKNVFDVTFIPKTQSPHDINLTWFNDPIPNTPIRVNAVDPENIVNFHYGKPVGVDCEVEGKSGDLKAVAIHDETDTHYKVKINKIHKSKYKLSFSPRDPGLYRVHVTMKDKEIPESPIFVNYGKPPKPEAVRVNGLNSKCYVGEAMTFTVDTTDAGSGDLTVKSQGPKQKKDKSELTVTDNKNGTHSVDYTPHTIGDHVFTIGWAGKAIPGSPFHSTAIEHTPDIITDIYLVENYNKPNQKKKEIPATEENIKSLLGNPLLLKVTVSDDLKDKEFTAFAAGKDTGPTETTITKTSSNTHEVLLNPQVQDVYTVTAKVGSKEVPRSPVDIKYVAPVSDPSKCRVTGVKELPSTMYVNKLLEFKVHTEDAGPGDLAVTANAPYVDEPPVVQVKQSPVESVYDVTYTPKDPGLHTLNFTWGGEPIPDTPVQVNISEAPTYGYGKPVGMDITADCKPADLEANAVHVESNTPYKVDIAKIHKGKYKLTLEPKDPGYYHIHVLLKQNEIPGSPFVIKYGKPPQSDKVSIRDQPDFVYVNRPINFTVDTSEAGSGELSLKASMPSNEQGLKQPELKVKDNKDGTFGIEFVPNVTGKHSFDVLWSGEAVPDSPVNVDVREQGMDLTDLIEDYAPKPIPIVEEIKEAIPVNEVESGNPAIPVEPDNSPSPPKEAELPDEEQPIKVERRSAPITIVIGKALKLKVKPKDETQRNGVLKAWAQGEVTGPAKVKTLQNEDGVFEVYFNPPEPDYYVIQVTLNGEKVPQSPFHVLYIPAPVDEPVVEPPPKQEELYAVFIPDQPIDYHIDLSKVPSGTLSAKCVGDECGSVPVTYEPVAPDSKKYRVAFVPPQPDLYHLSVFFNDKELKDSPFEIDLRRKKIDEGAAMMRMEDPVEAINVPEDIAQAPDEESIKEDTPSVDEQAETLDEVPSEEFTIFIGTPLVVKVHPKSDEQKNGRVSGTAIGDAVGTSEVSTYKRPGDDTHYFRFDPTEPDHYTVDVRMNDEPVPRSPFRVNYIMPPTDASKCRLIGAKDISDFVEVGSDVNLRVDAKKAGPGDLGVSAEPPSDEDSQEVTSMLSATPSQKDRGFYDITYIPQSQGKHSLAFTWADHAIPKSPVTIQVVDPSKTEVIPHGKPAAIDIDADGTLKATCVHKESNQNYKVKVNKVQKGKYRISFQPKDVGLYVVRAYLKDKEVPQSPFFIRYARPAKPEAVKVIGLDDRCYLGETVSFKVDTTEAGEGDFQIKTLGPDGKEAEIHHMDEKDGIYSIDLTPTTPGLHDLQMTWAGKNIPGHPFPLAVRDHSSEELLVQLYNVDRVGHRHTVDFPHDGEVLHSTTDQSLLLKVQARTDEQKKEKLTVTALNKETSEKTNLSVTKTKEDTFEAQFVPSVPQTYTFDAQLGSSPVPHTPFTVEYETPKADAGKCVILGLEKLPEKFQTNRPISFQVDTRLAGNGKLNLTAEGVQLKPKLVAKASKEDPRIIDVTYTPTAPGTHHIKVLWSGEPVPKSPLSFNVEAVPRSPYGKPVGYDLDLDAKAGDIDAYAIHEDTNTRLKVKTSKVSKGKYHFSFSPKKPGLYALHILVKKKDIKQSPIYFLYEGPPKPEACMVKDLPEEWFIHEQGTFLLDATEAGSADLQVKVTSPSKGKEGALKVNNNEDGTYTIEHTPEVLGEHKINLTWAGKAIPDSPVFTKVKKRVPRAKTCLGPYANVIPVGDRVELDVINLGKYTGDNNYVTASAKGKVGTDQPTVEDKDGMCKINFTPTVADDYTLNVKIHEQDVEGSPFLIKAVEKPCLAADYKPPEETCPTDVEVGKDVCLVVPKDEQLPPGSEPQVEAIGPEGPCEMQLIDQVESSYGLNFTPTVPGDYLVHVKKDKDAEKEIESSPFKIRAIEKESEAQKVYVPEDFQPLIADPIPLGTTIGIDINTADAGYGTLKVKQLAGGDGKANIELTEKGNSVYACKLTPTERGSCQLSILWNDEDIRGSPFKLTFVPVTGINLEGENFIVGTENKFTVDRKSVMEGKLEIYCSESQAADVTIQPADDGMEFYCVITVKKEGDYQIIAKYNGYHIVGSPFNVHFQKPAPTNMSFSLNAEGAETSDVSATVQNSLTLEQLPVNLTDLFGGQYGLEFIPTDGLEYLVTIKCRVKVKTVEKVIAGSPFALKYDKQPVDVSKCHAEGDGLAHAVAGQWSSFYVYTEGAGSGQLGVSMAGDVFGDEEAVITAVTPTKFEVKYILRTKGSYRIFVTWDGQDIPGSAFSVTCTTPEYDNNFGKPTFPSEVALGEPIAFTLTPTAPVDSNNIVVQARSKPSGVIPGKVTPSDDGSLRCSVEITQSGKYLVEVTHKSTPLPDTPFLVKVTQPPKPENVRAYGPGLEDGLVGQEGSFTIETENAGTGKMSLNVEGPKGGFKVDLNRHPDNDRTILASYSPQNPGLYVISIKWSGVEIPNSPFQVNIRDEGL